MSLVKLDQISKSYGQGEAATLALDRLNLTVAAGEFACIWGASGSGKSTLLNLIGLIDRPDSGRLTIDGTDVLALKDDQACQYRNHTLGFIFQNFNLVPVLSALENVMVPLQIRGEKDSKAREQARALLCEVGLEAQLHKRPDQMSGGQRQRIAVARALVTQPRLVLADEPTANLDSATSARLIALMQRLNRERGVTFIFSTHDQALLDYASRNIHLRDGQIVEDEASDLVTSAA